MASNTSNKDKEDEILVQKMMSSLVEQEQNSTATETPGSNPEPESNEQEAQVEEPAPQPQYYKQNDYYMERSCTQCGSSLFEEDHHSGDWICTQCGTVSADRLISDEAEYRIFTDDSESQSKVRVGAAYNPLMEYSLTEKSRLERDEKEFLWDGLKNIDEIFFRIYKGDSVNTEAQYRAKELFQKIFRLQVQQKKGAVPMKRSGEKRSKNRQKFSRRKQFVVSCIYQALKEHKIALRNGKERIQVEDIPAYLSDLLEGIQVSKYSVRHCLDDLDKLDSAQA